MAESAQWEQSLSKAIKSIVVIRVLSPRPFDTEDVGFSVATGFIVDAELGLICTNRHVVHPGPVRGDAIFHNHEEVDIWPVYRDPIHDFGFFRFNPKAVQFMEVSSLPLRPELARVGAQIRVVGNDAGEKLSILAGTLARLDRPAPRYGTGRYNDFNTFYFQAASSTSGGSSGSPVLDIDGNVIALNAGGKSTSASSFYLPLDRVCRALKLVQESPESIRVPRGGVQTIFKHRPYDELRRLGLPRDAEEQVRREFPEETGMLVVAMSVPLSPAALALQSGDILHSVDGQLLTQFIAMETVFDDSVGNPVHLTVYRGGARIELVLESENLDTITPHSFIEVSSAVLHPLSFQLAVAYAVPSGLVYLASTGYMFTQANIPRKSVIVSLANTPTPTIEDFVAVCRQLSHGQRVAVKYFTLDKPDDPIFRIVQIDRRWHDFSQYVRNDSTGLWDRTNLCPEPPRPPTRAPQTVFFEQASAPPAFPEAMHVLKSLCMVSNNIPMCIDGVHAMTFVGTGFVISKERGLVITDRNTVPNSLGDVSIEFASSLLVPAKIFYLHPIHNIAVLWYDPAALGDTDVRAIELCASPLRQGDPTCLVGLSKPDFFSPTYQPVFMSTRVTKIQEVGIPALQPPRYRQINLEIIHLDNECASEGSLLTDEQGRVQALWVSFATQNPDGKNVQFSSGLAIHYLAPMIESLRKGEEHVYTSLDVELWPISVAEARSLCVGPEWLSRFEQIQGGPRQIMYVRRVFAASPSAEFLKDGDLLLAVNNEVVSTFWQVEQLALQHPRLDLDIFREGAHFSINIPTVVLPGMGTDRLVSWSGCLIQETHRFVYLQQRTPVKGVYSSRWSFGSPAHKYNLRAAIFILEINETPVPDLDAFISVVSTIPDNSSVRIKTLSLNSTRPDVITLKTDAYYWPTIIHKRISSDHSELQWESSRIEIVSHSNLSTSASSSTSSQ